jgi:hypothetical protein
MSLGGNLHPHRLLHQHRHPRLLHLLHRDQGVKGVGTHSLCDLLTFQIFK